MWSLSYSEEQASEFCEISYRIGMSDFRMDTDLFEMLAEDVIHFVIHLMHESSENTSLLDAVQHNIDDGSIQGIWDNWCEHYAEFK